MNYIEQDTLTKDLRKLKGIMVALYALETDINKGNISKELDKAMGLLADQIFEIANDIDKILKSTGENNNK